MLARTSRVPGFMSTANIFVIVFPVSSSSPHTFGIFIKRIFKRLFLSFHIAVFMQYNTIPWYSRFARAMRYRVDVDRLNFNSNEFKRLGVKLTTRSQTKHLTIQFRLLNFSLEHGENTHKKFCTNCTGRRPAENGKIEGFEVGF